MEKPIIYVAGPLFTEYHRKHIEEIGAVCEKAGSKGRAGGGGFIAYLPHKNAGVFKRDCPSRPFFEKDLKAMDSCSACVALLDGLDVDSGTAFEIGYLYSKGIPIIGFLNDSRIFDQKKQLNLMISNSCVEIVSSLEELEEKLTELKAKA